MRRHVPAQAVRQDEKGGEIPSSLSFLISMGWAIPTHRREENLPY